MKKLIEIFMWQHEGEYEQYFFTVENEKLFIKDMMTYLNTIQVKDEFPWNNPLSEFKNEEQVERYFLLGDTPHLRKTYYLNFNYHSNFTIDKRTLEFKREEIKWEED